MTTELAELTLVAANQEQTIVSRHRTYPQWGATRGLTLEQYLARDSQMDIQEHAVNGRLVTWVLAPRNNTTSLDFKCACETFRRPSLVRICGRSSPEDAIGYGIASVFTPPENRRKGYAQHMMRLLHWVLASRSSSEGNCRLSPDAFPTAWGKPPPAVSPYGGASFSVLYSDVGSEFYRMCGPTGGNDGWVVCDPVGTIWDVSKFQPDLSLTADSGVHLEWLSEDGCKTLWVEDAKLMHCDLSNSSSPRAAFTFRPDNGVGAFQIRRTEFFLPGQTNNMPSKWGVRLTQNSLELNSSASVDPDLTFATWTIDIRPPPSTLIVTRLRSTVELFPTLAKLLLTVAHEMNIERVEVWNLPQELVALAFQANGVTAVRDEHLNSFKWYGRESAAEVEWFFNEKFAWC